MTDKPKHWTLEGVHRAFDEGWTDEEKDRHRRVTARAVEVFGNRVSAGVWESGFWEGHIIRSITHKDWAYEGLMAELDRLALTVVPEPGPDFEAIARRRRRR